jgi:signal transduction histidine kinase
MAAWRRDRWTARGERTVPMGYGARDVYGVVELGQPAQLLIRGTLLVLLDLGLLLALSAVAGWLGRGVLGRPGWLPERRAFRTRVAFSLGAFFLVPAAGFAALNILELARDRRSRRELQIAQTLRDAAPASTVPLSGTPSATRGLESLSDKLDPEFERLAERVDANLVLYRDGRLIASNGGRVFEDFGVVSPLVDPEVFSRIQLDGEPGAVTEGPSATLPTLIGMRAVSLPTGDPAMLGSPQSTGDPTIAAQQLDLAYGLALAVVGGLLAALVGAQLSARALSRPAADLRDAALAFGRGEPLPKPEEKPPAEFEPVFAALEKMASDIRATQEAQERAARVLAWGEMANQIAHEIKNPLTPMRLGIQHLLRLHKDGRPLGPALEETSKRILGEIDRLDTIARAFSRFAAPAEARPSLEPIALGEICREVVALYQLAPGGASVTFTATELAPVLGHRDEVKETLINLLENARNADATAIEVAVVGPILRVRDNGCGIEPDQLPRIFEPRFSTTTSGSGLGLAIVKRLVEGWGATIEVTSEVGKGTVVEIRFAAG